MRNKRALSPLIATVLLVIFALIIGTATMSWGRDYVKNLPDEKTNQAGSSYVISKEEISGNPLKKLQIDYIYDAIPLEEYLRREKAVIEEMDNPKN